MSPPCTKYTYWQSDESFKALCRCSSILKERMCTETFLKRAVNSNYVGKFGNIVAWPECHPEVTAAAAASQQLRHLARPRSHHPLGPNIPFRESLLSIYHFRVQWTRIKSSSDTHSFILFFISISSIIILFEKICNVSHKAIFHIGGHSAM